MTNPLLEPLGPYISQKDWPLKLAYDPLDGIETKKLSEEQRDLLLSTIRNRVEPTLKMVTTACTVRRMLRAGYDRRDPTLGTAQREQAGLFGLRGRKAVKNIPFGPIYADSLMMEGCTGLGKSTLIQRFCSLIPQLHVHGRSETAGWIKKIQITYLIVPMPTHRGGLLYAIISALDEVLGTEFRIQYRTNLGWTVEKLAIEVGVLLVQYSVGLLIIEELQPINFGDSPHRALMLNMLLRFLNFGIPIIFIGNPLAFVGIESHSQDLRRLTSVDPVEFMPYEADDPDWIDGLMPAMWRHNVMPESTLFDKEIGFELTVSSGGITDFLWKACAGSQRLALQDHKTTSVTAEHIRAYRRTSTAFAGCKDLIDGFRNHDPVPLSRYIDVPWEKYALRWGWGLEDIVAIGKVQGASSSLTSYDSAARRSFRTVHERLRTTLASKITREGNKIESNSRTRSSVPRTDIRSGTTDTLGKNLDELRAETGPARRLPK